MLLRLRRLKSESPSPDPPLLSLDCWLANGNRERSTARTQLVSDLADLTAPVSALKYLDLDDGIVGIGGTISSLIGLQAQWRKTA